VEDAAAAVPPPPPPPPPSVSGVKRSARDVLSANRTAALARATDAYNRRVASLVRARAARSAYSAHQRANDPDAFVHARAAAVDRARAVLDAARTRVLACARARGEAAEVVEVSDAESDAE